MKKCHRGIALVTVLIVSSILLILISSMVFLNVYNMNLLSGYRDRIASMEMAKAGISHCIYALSEDPAYSTDIDSRDFFTSDGYYSISFNPSKDYYSVNNLSGSSSSGTLNFRNKTVPANTADLVISARVNSTTQRVHVVMKMGMDTSRVITSNGKIVLKGDTSIGGIESLLNPASVPGMVHSNYSSQSNDEYSVFWDGTEDFILNGGGLISTVPGINISPISQSIKDAVDSDQINEIASNIPIPDIDIESAVESASSYPNPYYDSSSGNDYMATGQIMITNNAYMPGNYYIDGDLNLMGGTLYVNGDLTVDGAIRGVGSIYVTGNTSLTGDSSIITNKINGATVFSQGDIYMEGIDAMGYLNQLAGQSSSVNNTLSQVKTALTILQDEAESAEPNIHVLMQFSALLGQHYCETNEDLLYTLKYPSPDGYYSKANNSAYLPRLINSIKSYLGSSYDDDPKAQKVVDALEGMLYYFRSSYYPSNAGWVPSSKWGTWDDTGMTSKEKSIDHQYRVLTQDAWCNPDPNNDGFTQQDMANGISTYMAQNPLDLNWIGKNYFQGFVYTKGSIYISNRFHVVGVVMANGDITLESGSTLTFDQEFCNIVSNEPTTLRIISWEEL